MYPERTVRAVHMAIAISKAHLRELSALFTRLRTERESLAFLRDILTPNELADIAERWQIIKLLQKGIPQREISAKLKVSIAKVTRGSHALKRNYGGFLRFLRS